MLELSKYHFFLELCIINLLKFFVQKYFKILNLYRYFEFFLAHLFLQLMSILNIQLLLLKFFDKDRKRFYFLQYIIKLIILLLNYYLSIYPKNYIRINIVKKSFCIYQHDYI